MLARIGAATARLGARLGARAHVRIVAQAIAVLRAALADLGAHAAGAAMHIRAAKSGLLQSRLSGGV